MKFELTILGSGSALPTLNRNPSAQVLNIQDHFYLLDCGEGTQRQLRWKNFRINRIRKIFISHLHGDHFFGLPGLLSTMDLLGRQNDLYIYGPPGLQNVVEVQFAASNARMRYPIHWIVLEDGIQDLAETTIVTIKSFPLDHRLPCWGFRFDEKRRKRNLKKEFVEEYKPDFGIRQDVKAGADFTNDEGKVLKNANITNDPPRSRSYAYVPDTRYNESILEVIAGADLLFHEATFAKDMKKEAREKYHATTEEAATIAQKAHVKRLLIGHFSSRYKEVEPLVEEARAIFPETFAVNDGDSFTLDLEF